MRREIFQITGLVSALLCIIAGAARAETEGIKPNPSSAAGTSVPSAPITTQKKDEPKEESLKKPGAQSPSTPANGSETASEPAPEAGAPTAEKPVVEEASPEAAAAPNQGTTAASTTPPAAVRPPDDMEVLNIETDPPGAIISIGYAEDAVDQEVGEAPLALQLVASTYYITLRKEGYETAAAKVIVNKGENNWLRVRLNPEETSRLHGVRIAGNLTFWPGLATTLTGIILIVVDDPNKEINTDKTGFALVGVGLTLSIAGGLMLGLTYRDRGVYTMPDATAALTPPAGKHGLLSLTKRF